MAKADQKLLRILRLRVTDKPGYLGKVATRLGELDANIGDISIKSQGPDFIVREISLQLEDEEHLQMVVKAMSALEGIQVEDLIDPAKGDPIQQVKELTSGRGTDYAFEVIGLPDTILQAFNTARRGGTVVIVGMPRIEDTVTFSAMQLFYDEKKLLGCLYGSAQVRRDFPKLVSLVETGRLDINSMVSRRIKLDEVNDAFRAMEAGEVIRSVII